jgi:hypothetical protein
MRSPAEILATPSPGNALVGARYLTMRRRQRSSAFAPKNLSSSPTIEL